MANDNATDAIAAELAVRNVIARVAHLSDRGDPDEYLQIFTKDAIWDFPGDARRGRDEIVAGLRERRAAGRTGPGSGNRHAVTSIAVEILDGSHAEADSYVLFAGKRDGHPAILIAGRYHDDFELEDGAWRLARRQFIID